MYVTKAFAAAAATGILALSGAAFAGEAGTQVYFNDFNESGSAIAGWSKTNRTSSLSGPGSQGFLGEFGNETVSLPLTNLPGHDTITISFDLYIIRSWDGNTLTPGVGPDIWSTGMMHEGMDEHTFLATTFANQPPSHSRSQSYPLAYGDGNSPMYAGALEINSLGYRHEIFEEFSLSAVYQMEFTMEHSGSTAEFWFRAMGLQHLADESWGLDNVRVNVSGVPAPGALALLGIGGLVMGRRRR